MKPEFDKFSESYEQLLKDPIRDRFTSSGTEFFHIRKRDLILDYFRHKEVNSRTLAYLDVGCGKGELGHLLRSHFARLAGCDPSAGMMQTGSLSNDAIETRVQEDPGRIPFDRDVFDFATAVCVFHHVEPPARAGLLQEIRRVLKPGGTLAIIEHNPFNPVTQLIVSRTPVDSDAILLRPSETRRLLREAGFKVDDQRYFLYFPESIYRPLRTLESVLAKVPLGGQYAVFGKSV